MTSATLPTRTRDQAGLLSLIFGISAWGAAVAALGAFGLFDVFAGPLITIPVGLSIAAPVAIYFTRPSVRATVDGIGIGRLTAVHLLRVVGAILILRLGTRGEMNALLASFAGWGDLIAATVALIALALPYQRWRFILAHVVSLADFSASLSVGTWLALSVPTNGAPAAPLAPPFILLFVIGFYASNSIIVLNALLRRPPTLRGLNDQVADTSQ